MTDISIDSLFAIGVNFLKFPPYYYNGNHTFYLYGFQAPPKMPSQRIIKTVQAQPYSIS